KELARSDGGEIQIGRAECGSRRRPGACRLAGHGGLERREGSTQSNRQRAGEENNASAHGACEETGYRAVGNLRRRRVEEPFFERPYPDGGCGSAQSRAA